MSEKLRESLSAIIDDEADEFELRRVLDEMEKHAHLRETWDRYHLIGTYMRGEGAGRSADLRDKVWSALELENPESPEKLDAHRPADDNDEAAAPPRLGRMVGLAVAATVAFAVVFGVGAFDFDEPAAPSVAVSNVTIDGPRLQEIQLTQEVSATDMQRANAYMMHHVQQQALNQAGVASFVKLVTYERK